MGSFAVTIRASGTAHTSPVKVIPARWLIALLEAIWRR